MSAHHARQRLDLGRTRRAAALADVLVLLAVEQHEEEAFADRHRRAAAGAVEQARLERAVPFGRARAAATEHAPMVSPERRRPQRRDRLFAQPPGKALVGTRSSNPEPCDGPPGPVTPGPRPAPVASRSIVQYWCLTWRSGPCAWTPSPSGRWQRSGVRRACPSRAR